MLRRLLATVLAFVEPPSLPHHVETDLLEWDADKTVELTLEQIAEIEEQDQVASA